MAQAHHGNDRVVSALIGRPCNHCESGELVRGSHKGSPAVVCSSCDVPQVSFTAAPRR